MGRDLSESMEHLVGTVVAGFHKIAAGSGFQAFIDFVFKGRAGINENWYGFELRMSADPFEQGEAAHARHFQVGHDGIGQRMCLAAFVAVSAFKIMAGGLAVRQRQVSMLWKHFSQGAFEEKAVILVVFGMEDERG